MDHFLRIDELCVSMQAVSQEISADEHLVILLGSLTREYDQMFKSIENLHGMTPFQAKDILRREYDGRVRTENDEVAFKTTRMPKFKNESRRFRGRSCVN